MIKQLSLALIGAVLSVPFLAMLPTQQASAATTWTYITGLTVVRQEYDLRTAPPTLDWDRYERDRSIWKMDHKTVPYVSPTDSYYWMRNKILDSPGCSLRNHDNKFEVLASSYNQMIHGIYAVESAVDTVVAVVHRKHPSDTVVEYNNRMTTISNHVDSICHYIQNPWTRRTW